MARRVYGESSLHPNNRNHPNFSYDNSNNALQLPPSFNVVNGVIQELVKKITLEEMMEQLVKQQKDFIVKTDLKIGALDHSMTTIGNTLMTFRKQLKMVGNKSDNWQMLTLTCTNKANSRGIPSKIRTQHCHDIEHRSGTRYTNEALEIEDLEDGSKTVSETGER